MSRNVKRRLSPTSEPTTVVSDDLETFARRLHYALLDRDMSQSDLARKVWGQTRTDARGYETVVGKDRISSYINGKQMPEPKTLKKIADALKMKPEDLAPDLAASAIERGSPEVEMKLMGGHTDKALLRVNKLLPLSLAAEIIKMISDFEKAK